jgi:hypothetical protein
MADDFMVGFGFMSVGGLLWLIFGGIFKTPDFDRQLGFAADTAPPAIGISQEVGVFLADLSMALMVLGPLVFWIAVPVAKWAVVKRRRQLKAAE